MGVDPLAWMTLRFPQKDVVGWYHSLGEFAMSRGLQPPRWKTWPWPMAKEGIGPLCRWTLGCYHLGYFWECVRRRPQGLDLQNRGLERNWRRTWALALRHLWTRSFRGGSGYWQPFRERVHWWCEEPLLPSQQSRVHDCPLPDMLTVGVL
jgi:hypothetical protein